MFFGFRLILLLLSTVMICSALLMPQEGKIELSLAATLMRTEKTLGELKRAGLSPLKIWREFESLLLEELSTIHQVGLSQEEIASLSVNIQNIALPLIKEVILQESKTLQTLSSYERHLLAQMVEMGLKAVKKGSIAFRFMSRIHEKLEGYEKTPYEYLKGDLVNQSPQGSVRFFSWNTCLLPGGLAKIYSGLAPASQRLELVIAQIKEQTADVVCLQEVHSQQAAKALYQALKAEYAHFYMNMGPKMFGQDLKGAGLNSGLFVASKVPLEAAYFEDFNPLGGDQQINKGFFGASIQGAPLSFINCHLQAGDQKQDQDLRYHQLGRIKRFISDQTTPIRLLIGDLNTPFGSGEQSEELIQECFFDPYNKNRSTVTKYSRTFSDRFISGKQDGSCEILDYFLVYHLPGFEKYAFITERIEGFDEVNFKNKGSDHHGLCSQVIFPQK